MSDDDFESPDTVPAGIAVVGMSGRFPGAPNVEAFWRNLRDGVCSISFFSPAELAAAGVSAAEVADPRYVPAAGVLDGAELFDAALFGLTPREAEVMDPQQRVFLECAWAALEDAGCDPQRHPGWVGVYAGSALGTYLWMNVARSPEALAAVGGFQAMISNDKDYLATQVSYRLNLRGPSVAVQTACSTSLVAVHLACQGLVSGECDLALAGGVSVGLPERRGYLYQEKGIASPDGFCRPFDAAAAGTVRGSGVGIVVLKRLADALAQGDRVLAVIKGSAINNDGAGKVGYTAPSVSGQAEVIAAALAVADVEPESIGYVEAHGTATRLGDPIEVAALAEAFGGAAGGRGTCALGSVKGNVGHLDAAAGVTGLIKTVLALAHRELPASLHYTSPNPEIDFSASPFHVNAERRPWPAADGPRRAGVSSFGIGGTNAHVVLEEAPAARRRPAAGSTEPAGRGWQLLPLAAQSAAALAALAGNLADHLRSHGELDLADAAFTLQVGRRELAVRRVVLARDRDEAAARLDALRSLETVAVGERPEARPAVAFVFAGQGAQYRGMAAELCREEPVFRQVVDECCGLLGAPLGDEVRRWITAGGGEDESGDGETWRAQPALFVCEVALARLWMSWGIEPAAVVGHSVGEYAAAAVAGVMPLAAALGLVALRGRLMQALPPGAMVAVGLAEDELLPRLGAELALAAVNGPRQCVVSGAAAAVAELEAALRKEGVAVRRLRTSHAFHSPMMDPMLAELRQAVERLPLAPPRIPYLSSLSGDWAGDEVAAPEHWVRQARRTVRFAAALDRLLDEPERVLLEVGPRQGLGQLARQLAEARSQPPPRVVEGLRARRADLRGVEDGVAAGEEEQLLGALGQLWMHGVAVDWSGFHAGARRQRVSLPSYPFARHRYWLAPPSGDESEVGEAAVRRPLSRWFHLPSWRRTLPPRRAQRPNELIESGAEAAPAAARRRCLILADDGGLGEALGAAHRADGWDVTLAAVAGSWEARGGGSYGMRPGDAGDHARLWQEMAAGPGLPQRVIHLWNLTGAGVTEGLTAVLDRSFYSLFHLAQAVGRLAPAAPLELLVVADGLHAVESGDRPQPVKAALLGICRVLAQEQDAIRCRSVDLPADLPAGLLVERCLAELDELASAAMPGAVPTAAWRGPYRCVPSWDELALDAPPAGGGGLRRGGVYVVTGGLGGLGLEIAQALAESAQARLVLVGRSALPSRELWDAGEPDGAALPAAVARKILRLRALEAAGAEVLVVSGDVADSAQMESVRGQALARFGRVDGVFHAAGIAGGGLLATRTAAQAAAVLAPKVQGTFVLARVFADAELLVLCSSLAALVGGIGQADYAAANSFLDGFAAAAGSAENAAAGGPRTISIDWDAWQRVGMAAETEIPAELRAWHAAQLAAAIEPDEGRAALGRILAVAAVGAGGPSQVAVSVHPLAGRLAAAASLRLSAAIAASDAAGETEPGRPRAARHPRPASAPPYTAPATALEARLAEAWEDLLGIEPIGRDDDFFDLGGHSLLAIQLASRIGRQLGVDLPLHAVMAGSTPGRLAAALAALGAGVEDGVALPAAAAVGRLVALQPEGTRPPLFCVHPAGGNTFAYLDLVRCLGTGQPLYALQSDGLDTPFVAGLTLERMAESYVAAIRRAQPAGPYHVGGWSMGGLVAYEVAQQLLAAGEEVALLVLFDTRADTRPEGFAELPEDEAELLYILYRDELDLSRERMAALPPGGALAYVIERAQAAGQLAADFGFEQAEKLMAVYMRNRRLMWNYTPRPYAGSMVLFQARERRPGEELPVGLRWDALVRGGLATQVVPGEHNNLLTPPYVEEVAARLTRLFDDLATAGG